MRFLKDKKRMPITMTVTILVLALPILIKAIANNEFGVMIACISLIYIIAVSGLDILFGYCGQISLGHAAFFVIGAYTSGLLNNYFGIPLAITIAAGATFSALIGGLLAYPASKLKFHFLSLATIAFGEIVFNFLYVSPGGFTGNYLGMYVKGISFLTNYTRWYYFLLFWVVLALLGKYFLVNSRTGRAFIAIRENTHAADGMGVNVRSHKIIAFMVSAFYTGFAGAIFVHLIKYISPETSKQKQSVLFLTMLLFGGTSSMIGPIIGVVVIEILLEVIRPLQEYQMLLYGVLLLIVILALPGGIHGGIKDLVVSFKRKKQVAAGGVPLEDMEEGDNDA